MTSYLEAVQTTSPPWPDNHRLPADNSLVSNTSSSDAGLPLRKLGLHKCARAMASPFIIDHSAEKAVGSQSRPAPPHHACIRPDNEVHREASDSVRLKYGSGSIKPPAAVISPYGEDMTPRQSSPLRLSTPDPQQGNHRVIVASALIRSSRGSRHTSEVLDEVQSW